MKLNRSLEQHIAVFGESGSGKTVLVSSFYGAAQEPEFLEKSLFNIVADDVGKGNRLHRNFLGMKNSAQLPEITRFSATSYSFSVKLKKENQDADSMKRPIDSLKLVWHDYPGEWFENGVSGPEEKSRRLDTFRSLLGSDVALVLVDGQKLLDNVGEEERYLKSLFGNLRNGILGLQDDLLYEGKPLVEFPRIWIIALSKADLLPELDVFAFRDLIIQKAADDVEAFRQMLCGLVDAPEALSVGEDFTLLSSARFEPGKIEVTQRVGVDLILPMSAILPLERHASWLKTMQLPFLVVDNLLDGLRPIVLLLSAALVPRNPFFVFLERFKLDKEQILDYVIDWGKGKLKEMNADALDEGEYLAAMITGFGIALETGEKKRILLLSKK